MTKCKDFGGISGNFSTTILISLRVLQAPLYICGLRVSVGGRLNLIIKHNVLANIVTIAFVLLGGRRSLPFPTRARVV